MLVQQGARAQRWKLWHMLEGSSPNATDELTLNVQTKEIDSLTQAEYGVQTWTTGQAVRDMLQNHLDAEADEYLQRLLTAVVDMQRLRVEDCTGENAQKFHDFCYAIYRFAKHGDHGGEAAAKEWKMLIGRHGAGLPLRVGIGREGVDLERLAALVRGVEPERKPSVHFAVQDLRMRNAPLVWVTEEQLCQPPYSAMIEENTQQTPQYVIMGMEIHDDGTGFDAKLTEFYKSSKTAAQHLRGRFGEGLKMNFAHLVRNNVDVAARSSFRYEEAGKMVQRVWRRTPYMGENGRVFLKSAEAEVPSHVVAPSGSSTTIFFGRAPEELQTEIRANIDPRLKQGLASNCIDYASDQYRYPLPTIIKRTGEFTMATVGVSLTADPKLQYVQGLRIEGDTDYFERLFSYDVLESAVLKGRDRNQMGDDARSMIFEFWANVDDPEILRAFAKRVITSQSRGTVLEVNAMKILMDKDVNYRGDLPLAQQTLFDVLPGVLGLREGGKHVLLTAKQRADPMMRGACAALERQGFVLFEAPQNATALRFERFNTYHQGRYHVQTLEQSLALLRADHQTRLPQEHPEVAQIMPIVSGAVRNLQKMLRTAGVSAEFDVDFRETLDAATEQPLETLWISDAQRAVLIVRPKLLIAANAVSGGGAYWMRRAQAQLLSALSSTQAHKKPSDVFNEAQDLAQEVLDASMSSAAADYRAVPDFRHVVDQGKQRSSADALYGSNESFQASMRGWAAYNVATRYSASIDEMVRTAATLTELPEPYRSATAEQLMDRVVVEGDRVLHPSYTPDGVGGYKRSFAEAALSASPVVGQVEGSPVYAVAGYLLQPILPPLKEGDVVTIGETEKYVFSGGHLLQYASQLRTFGKSFHRYSFRFGGSLQSGCLIVHSNLSDATQSIERMKQARSSIHIERAGEGAPPVMTMLAGLIPTQLPKEYGKDEWDNPVRVFQDVVQNHIDAAKGTVALAYKVLRGKQYVWVSAAEMRKDDKLVGLRVRDDGGGYGPDNLGTMGFTSKKSPLFSGKYGEGQKMVAAAAARNGMELSFSSVAAYGKTQRRWAARVATKREQFFQAGKGAADVDRVVFDLSSEAQAAPEPYTSETVLCLPEGQTSGPVAEWFDIIDPRRKDERGNGGLARYVRALRTEAPSKRVIDLGCMRILLDEPGCIYENGLLVVRDTEQYAFGYDVPSVTSTRERNAVDQEQLQAYITYALENSMHFSYIENILQTLRDQTFTDLKSDRGYVKHIDLKIDSMLQYKHFIPSLPHWRKACKTVFPGKFVHSEQEEARALQYLIADLQFEQTEGRDNPRDPACKAAELRRAINRKAHAMVNMRHLSSDNVVEMPEHLYQGFSKVMPTATQYLETLMETEIAVDDATRIGLQKVVTQSAREIADVFAFMERGDKRRLGGLLLAAGKPAEGPEADAAIAAAREKLAFWSDSQQVASAPRAVFVSPAAAGYHGIAHPRSIGINETLLLAAHRKRLVGVIRHELLHAVTGLRDYTPEFVILLLELADREGQKPQPQPI